MAGVTRPPTVRATIASANLRPRKSAGSTLGSMQVITYSPLWGRNGRRGVLWRTALAAKAALRVSRVSMLDMWLRLLLSGRRGSSVWTCAGRHKTQDGPIP
jgi:hypothetical protein